ncbi:hypothetical protein MXL54_04425 [Enterobacteriaceae bacterium G50]|nr:hypothetical protein [Enterobacteriaceae bacterium G50]
MRGIVLAALLTLTPMGVYAHSNSNEHPDLPSLSAEDYALPDTLNLPRNATNAWIKQNGDGLRADINQYQTGRNTHAIIQQQGGGHMADITQLYGNNDLAIISQAGWGNDAEIIQKGSGNAAAISQDGFSNYAKIVQVGNNLAGIKVSQTGVGKAITVKVTHGYTR